MKVARELTNCEDGFLNDKQYLIMDRDTKFCASFRKFLSDEGVKGVRTSPRTPNMNSHLERFFGSLKSECLSRLILFGENSVRRAVCQYLTHYHRERCHQDLANELIMPLERSPDEKARSKQPSALAVCFDHIAELPKIGYTTIISSLHCS